MRYSIPMWVVTLVVCFTSTAHGASQLGRWSPGVGNARNAIYYEFCGHRYVVCALGDQAYRVARCETGGTFSVWAGVGKHPYWGLFQMGSHERQLWGYGTDPWRQAAGAKRYYDYSRRVSHDGWRPWDCKP